MFLGELNDGRLLDENEENMDSPYKNLRELPIQNSIQVHQRLVLLIELVFFPLFLKKNIICCFKCALD